MATATCQQCRKDIGVDHDNTLLFRFSLMPEYNYVNVVCDNGNCEGVASAFVNAEQTADLVRLEFSTQDQRVPSGQVIQEYLDYHEIELVKPYGDELAQSIRDRHDKLARIMAFDLEGATAEDIIYAPKGKYPVRWD